MRKFLLPALLAVLCLGVNAQSKKAITELFQKFTRIVLRNGVRSEVPKYLNINMMTMAF